MNRKKVAWLLTVAMVATSADSSVLMASASDFSAETAEIAQDFTSEPLEETAEPKQDAVEAADPSDAAGISEAGELGSLAESQPAQQSEIPEENQDFMFEDGNGGLTDDTLNADLEAEGLTEVADNTEELAQFASDGEDSTADSDGMTAELAEKAIEVPYKDFLSIADQIPAGKKTVLKFTAPKTGKYRFAISDVSYGGDTPIYDSSFQKCEVEGYNDVFTAQEGETYYIIYNLDYVGDVIAGVFPTVESYEWIKEPRLDYTLWEDEVFLAGVGGSVKCTYSNGDIEELTEGNDDVWFNISVVDHNGYGTIHLDESGTYKATLNIFKTVNGKSQCLYDFDIEDITVRTLKELFENNKDKVVELTTSEEGVKTDERDSDGRLTDQFLHFSPKEDGKYTFTNEVHDESGYSMDLIALLDENGEKITTDSDGRIEAELVAGKDYYLAINRSEYEKSYNLTKVTQAKKIQSITVDTPEIVKCIGKDDVHRWNLLNSLKVTVNYTDGTSEMITGSSSTSEGEYLTSDMDSVTCDDEENAQPGEYTIPISIGTMTANVQLKVQTLVDYCEERAEELTLDQKKITKIESEDSLYCYKITATEDGIYTFSYEAEVNGEEKGGFDYSVGYYNSKGESIEETSELKAGDIVYIIVQSGSDTGYDFCITPSRRTYILTGLELVSEPSDTNYAEYIDFRNTYNITPKTEGLEVKAIYSDKEEEILGAGDSSRDGSSLSVNISYEREYDEETEESIQKYYMNISMDGYSVKVPVSVMDLPQYISTYGSDVKAITPGVDENVEWNGSNGYLYRFTPEESKEYIFTSTGNGDTYGLLFDENGEELASDDDGGESNNFKLSNKLEAGKTYYYLARPLSSIVGTGTVQLYKKDCIVKENCIIKEPNKTTLVSGIDSSDYEGLEVTAVYESGKTVTYIYDEDDFWDHISILNVPQFDENGKLIPGSYTLKIECDNEEVGTVPITVLSMSEYLEQSATKLQAGVRTPVKLAAKTTTAYYAVAPATGYYKVDYLASVEAGITYYDAQGNRSESAVKVEKDQKFYFTLQNYFDWDVKALVTPVTQEAVLESLTIKSEPEKKTFIEKIDYSYSSFQFTEEYAKGLVVTARYSDGKTEELKYGDKSRYGDTLSVKLSYSYDEEENENSVLMISMSGIRAENIPVELVKFKDYLKNNGENLEALPANKMKSVTLNGQRYQIYSFVPEKTADYTFYSTGDIDTYGNIFDQDGEQIAYNDDSGENSNFKITEELTAGTRYYLGVRAYGSGTGQCMIGITSQENQEPENPDKPDETLKLSDFQLVSEPSKTAFYAYNSDGELNTYAISYDGLKISAKDESGETKTYSYSKDKDEFPFTVNSNIARDDEGMPVAGQYTAEVLFNGEKAAEFGIEVKSFQDYLAGITTVLNPGEILEKGNCEPMTNGNLLYVKLPSDLSGRYYYYTNEWKWNLAGIYDSQGKRISQTLNASDDLQFAGGNYYLCLEDQNSEGIGSFQYEKISSAGALKTVEIVSEPEVTEYLEGMQGSLNLTGMVVRIQNENGAEKTVPVDSYSDLYGRQVRILNEEGTEISEISELKKGENALTLELGNIKVPFTLSVASAVNKQADSLVLDKETVFSITENSKYHVYSYTAEETGTYRFSEYMKAENQFENVSYDAYGGFYTDDQGEVLGKWNRYNTYRLTKGKTYYFVPYCNEKAIGTMSVTLKQLNSYSDVLAMEVTSLPKTEYEPSDSITYEGMLIHVIYDDGTEKDLTAEEAQESDIYIGNRVQYRNGMMVPGNYQIEISYNGTHGEGVRCSVPITVNNNGIQELVLSNQTIEINASAAGKLYEFEAVSAGYYQLVVTVENGNYAAFSLGNNSYNAYSDSGNSDTRYSSLTYLNAGKNYLYLSGARWSEEEEETVEGTCKLQLVDYSSVPVRIEFVEDSLNTDFVYGQPVDFAGAQFKVIYADDTEKLVTIPENYSTYRTLETGLYLSECSSSIGKHQLNAYISMDSSAACEVSVPYTVQYAKDLTELEDGKTYTITADQLTNQRVVYTVKGTTGIQICGIEYHGAYVEVEAESGDFRSSSTEYGNNGTLYFAAQPNKTYYILVGGSDDEDDEWDDSSATTGATIKLTRTKVITGITALPEENAEYYYGLNENDRNFLKVQLTYADGTTEVLQNDGQAKSDVRTNLIDLRMENIAGAGTFNGQLVLGNLRADYSRTVQNPEVTEIKNSEYVKLTESDRFKRFKFVPEKTQLYSYKAYGLYDYQNITLRNEKGAVLCTWNVEESPAEMTLTAGKTYYFDVRNYNEEWGFAVTDNPEAVVTPSPTPVPTATPIPTEIPVPEPTETPVPNPSEKPEPTPTAAPAPEPTKAPATPTPTATPIPATPTPTATPIPTAVPTATPTQTPAPTATPVPLRDISEATVTGIDESYIYTGKAIIPVATVTYAGQNLTADVDYSVAYTNNDNSGTATITVTGKGAYTGEKTVTFQILNKITYRLNGGKQNSKNKTTFYRQTVKLYSPTRKGYTFGGWYKDKKFKKKMTSISKNTVKNVTIYAKWIKVTKCKAPTNVKLRNSKAKTMAVSYKAVSKAKGYEISYATNTKFKGAKKVLTGAKSRNINKLQKGKTYYVRIRAYKVDSTGAKVYGSYSKTAKVKIKK